MTYLQSRLYNPIPFGAYKAQPDEINQAVIKKSSFFILSKISTNTIDKQQNNDTHCTSPCFHVLD